MTVPAAPNLARGQLSPDAVGYNRAMIFKGTDSDNGLVTVNLSQTFDVQCMAVHDQFLKAHGIKMWALTVVGSQQPEVTATSNPPDGHEGSTKTITLTLDFPDDLRLFLETEYQQYVARR